MGSSLSIFNRNSPVNTQTHSVETTPNTNSASSASSATPSIPNSHPYSTYPANSSAPLSTSSKSLLNPSPSSSPTSTSTAALVPTISISSPAHSPDAPFQVFISHAGEDKVSIAMPLREKLQKRGVTAFVDMEDMPFGTEAKQAMMHAMQTASVGVFVMSPEFVAREWPMKELMHFLKRHDECQASGLQGPTITPFFYRLAISELYDEPRLDRTDKDGRNIYEKSRFYVRQERGDPEASIAGIKAALKKLHGIMGLENYVNANNDAGYEMYQRREMILDKLCDKICEPMHESAVPRADMPPMPISETGTDTFRAHFDVPDDVSELVFDFDRKNSKGDACTQEGKILQKLLDESMERNRTITVQGIGGVGKTSLVRKIRSLDTVLKRFKDGVYYMELGKDATSKSLQAALIRAISKSGGKQTAEKMRTETNTEDVIDTFRSWFAEKETLFVIDDVWLTKEITRATVRVLRTLYTSGKDSKTLLTTRSAEIKVDSEACCLLEPRNPLEDESRAILYHYAILKPQQGKEDDNKAVNNILERCAGLPLFLCVAGKGVKTLSLRQGHEGCLAYRVYSDQLETNIDLMVTTGTESHAGLSEGLKISIDLVEERKEQFSFCVRCSMAEMHRRLSVMKKQLRVPMSMLKHLWEVKHESQAARIAKEFEQVGLAYVGFEKAEGVDVEVLRLHDSVYEFAVYETKKCKKGRIANSMSDGHKAIVEGYAKRLKTRSKVREWWSKNLGDDKYIHGNVCRHLMGAGLEEELFGLLLSPKWLARQVQLNGIAFTEGDFLIGNEAIQKCKEQAGQTEFDDTEEALQMIGGAITLSSSFILKNGRELWFHIHGRLKRRGEYNELVREYLRRIEREAPRPRMLCLNGFLIEPGGGTTKIIPIGTGVECIVVLNDGALVACGCSDGDVTIVNIRTSERQSRWRAHHDWVTAIDAQTDDTQIVTGSEDGTAKVWDAQTGMCVATFDGHKCLVSCVAATHDGKRVVTGSVDGIVRTWNIERGRRMRSSVKTKSMMCLTLFNDETFAVMAGNKGEVQIWNLRTHVKIGASLHRHSNIVQCAVISADERRLVTGSMDHTIRLWDLETHQPIGGSFKGHTDSISCVALSRDGRRIASGSYDMTIRLWDTESEQKLCDPLIGHTGIVTGVSFLRKEDTIVSSSYDGTVRVWDIRRKTKKMVLDMHSSAVSGVSFTPNGSLVITGSLDGTVRIWNTTSGKSIAILIPEKSSFVNGVAVTPNGLFAISVSDDEAVRVWDIQTRVLRHTLTGHAGAVLCVAVTPDGDLAVTGSEDRTIRLWDMKLMDGSHSVLEGHSAAVWRIFVSDDGLRIISMDVDGDIFVWDKEARVITKRSRKEEARKMSRRQVLDVVGEATVHDEGGLSVPLDGNEILHSGVSGAPVLTTLDTNIRVWDISPDKTTICVGLRDGLVGFLKLQL